MKKLECFIRPEKLEPVKEALFAIGIRGMSISQVRGHGQQKGIKLVGRTGEYCVQWIDKLKLEIVINESQKVDEIIDVIVKNAATGNLGDGKIFIIPVEEAIRIRTGERGDTVL
ncbi:MAG: P-II family nitrogen regulator [Promethearchaeota archaeon]|nr:MAG: P-II family nitrogen regulator [Candidatus Lokiarchaeota archaeon]